MQHNNILIRKQTIIEEARRILKADFKKLFCFFIFLFESTFSEETPEEINNFDSRRRRTNNVSLNHYLRRFITKKLNASKIILAACF